MTPWFVFIVAMGISMVLIPMMIRLAPSVGMMDKPESRKVHTQPVPRVGGVGIVFGALLPIMVFLDLDAATGSYVFGALVLFVFGTWDDCRELGHYAKLVGQFLAVVPVVYYGDLYVSVLPLAEGSELSPGIGKPFTVFAMIGLINALNHSDGLDGLAGGESVLSMGCLAYLAYIAEGEVLVTIAMALIGGVFGFLRFNSHPARVFMGDGGSQFLGFTLAFVLVSLTQEVNTAVSPALAALIVGLPVMDILSVFAQRVYHRMNWFRATRNHVHHRLLALGFEHFGVVVIIYSIHALLVVSAIVMRYQSDAVILWYALLVFTTLFVSLSIAEKTGWKFSGENFRARLPGFLFIAGERTKAERLIVTSVAGGISIFLVFGSLLGTKVPIDVAAGSLALGALLGLLLLIRKAPSLVSHGISFVTLGFVAYLTEVSPADFLVAGGGIWEIVFFGVLAVLIALGIRLERKQSFRLTPTDYLLVLIVVTLAFSPVAHAENEYLFGILVKVVILYYGAEYVLNQRGRPMNAVVASTMVSLVLLSVRGFLPGAN